MGYLAVSGDVLMVTIGGTTGFPWVGVSHGWRLETLLCSERARVWKCCLHILKLSGCKALRGQSWESFLLAKAREPRPCTASY